MCIHVYLKYVNLCLLIVTFFFVATLDNPMADQRMDISSTISDFMSPDPAELISSSLSTSGVDCNRKRKGSSTDYQ